MIVTTIAVINCHTYVRINVVINNFLFHCERRFTLTTFARWQNQAVTVDHTM